MHRVLVISHTYIPPSNRGKLRALAARGLEVTVGVPQRWRDPILGSTREVAWERQNGVEVFPLPARHHGDAATLAFGSRALHALLRDKRPDLIQVEEEPTGPAARQVVRAARQLKLPAVLFTHQNVGLPLPWLAGWRRNRTLRRLRGAIAGSEGAAALLRSLVPGARAADLGRTRGARGRGGDGPRGDRARDQRGRDARGDRRRGAGGAGRRPAGALGGAAPPRRRRPAPPARAGGAGAGDAALLG